MFSPGSRLGASAQSLAQVSAQAFTPNSIADCCVWVEWDDLNFTAGQGVTSFKNRALQGGLYTCPNTGGAQAGTGFLNGNKFLTGTGTSATAYANANAMNGQYNGAGQFFALVNPTSLAVVNSLFGGASGCCQFRIETTGKLTVIRENISIIATSTGSIGTGRWRQIGLSYNPNTGVAKFRIDKAQDSTVTNAVTVNAACNGLLYDGSTNTSFLNGSVAALISYQRELAGPEIEAVENYLSAKYGV